MSRDRVRRPHLYLPASRAAPSHPPGALSTTVCGPTYCPSIVPATAAWSVPRRDAEGQERRKAGFHGFGGEIPHGPLCRGTTGGSASGRCCCGAALAGSVSSLTCCAGPCLLLTIKNTIFSFFHRFYNSLFRETVSCPLQKPTVHLSPGMRIVTFPHAFARHGLAGVPNPRRACLPSCFSAWDRWHFKQTPPPP